MAAPITLQLIQDTAYLPGDCIELQINDVMQPDRIAMWGPERQARGFGFGDPALTPCGIWGLLPSDVLFGAGLFGQGAGGLTVTTLRSFVAGDYAVCVRGSDQRPDAGNVGTWSDPMTIEHRPVPPAPQDLQVAAGVLSWDWSDP